MNTRALGYVCILLALLFWAGNATVGRMAPQAQIPPLGLNFWRWMVALLVLAPLALPKLRIQWRRLRAHWLPCTVFGMVTVAGFNAVFYIGTQPSCREH
jgi:drug/metabolite transporter (DMT)-like permease